MRTLSLPVGFVEQRTDNRVWWVKSEWASLLPQAITQGGCVPVPSDSVLLTPHSSPAIPGGRGPIQRLELDSHVVAIVRHYRRGGFVRHFVSDLYWDRPPRPFVELGCIEEARRRGVPTVEVLGACVEWTMEVLYRGWLITREASGFRTLWEWLPTAESTTVRQPMLTAVADAVARMHKSGIAHADLNPTNILVDPASVPPQVLIIDFDRARVCSSPISPQDREANLHRLQRYLRKYDIQEQRLTTGEFAYFRQVYEAASMLQRGK